MKVLSNILHRIGGTVGLLLLVGCADQRRSALDPAGLQAARISREWWFFFWPAVAIYVWVIFALLLGIARLKRLKTEARTVPPEPARERRVLAIITGAV